MKINIHSHTRLRCILRVACVSLTLAIILGVGYQTSAQTQPSSGSGQSTSQNIDRTRLEVIEDLSESLANDLLELSVATRNRDARLTAAFIPPTLVSAPFLSRPLPVKSDVKWIGTRGWTTEQVRADSLEMRNAHSETLVPPRTITREEFMRHWSLFLDHFSEIDDARFKVKAATFDDSASSMPSAEVPTATVGSKGIARVAFYVIGRNRDGQREWVRGVADVAVRYADTKRWQFERFTLVSLDSMVAGTDIFSEVSKPAGLSAAIPAYGDPGNSGFIWLGAAAADFNGDGWIDLFVTAADRNYLFISTMATDIFETLRKTRA